MQAKKESKSMIKETFTGITYIKLGDIASALVGVEDDSIPGNRFDTIEQVYDAFCDGKFSWGDNDFTLVKLNRFVQEFPFTSLVLDNFDLTSEHIFVLLEE